MHRPYNISHKLYKVILNYLRGSKLMLPKRTSNLIINCMWALFCVFDYYLL